MPVPYYRKRKWTKTQLKIAISESISIRQILKKLNLKAAGGNYTQIQKYIKQYKFDISHIKGKGWSKNKTGIGINRLSLNKILVENSDFQSFKLKKRLFQAKIKMPICEICGWSERTIDGRIPVELDHINGNKFDNRLINLRILCPNCHSLQSTHRGKNKRYKGSMAE